jgi:hypothetical protein
VECASFDEFDLCAAALLSWEIEAVQLDRGPFAGELIQAGSPTSLVSEMTFERSLHQSGQPPRGRRTLGVPADPAQRIFFRNRWTHGNQLLFFQPGSELDCVSVAGFHVFSVSFEEGHLAETCQALAGTDYTSLLAGREVVDCSTGVMQSVRQAIHRFMSSSVRCRDAGAQAEFAPEVGATLSRGALSCGRRQPPDTRIRLSRTL